VTNSLNKAYFLHESDPVFNGFVVENHGRLGSVPGNDAGQAGQTVHARSGKADYNAGSLAVDDGATGRTGALKNRVQEGHAG